MSRKGFREKNMGAAKRACRQAENGLHTLFKFALRRYKMHKLSFLIFSKGYVNNTMSLIRDMYDIADEIVLIDQSSGKERNIIERFKKREKLAKLRISYAVALGYPDPLRMYALKKCRYDWVLFLDTDERLSSGLKAHLKEVIGGKPDAYAIRRYEEVGDPKRLPLLSTWQTRLFRKDSVEFTGMPHEQAIVKGRFERIADADYYMMHMSNLMSRKTQFDYMELSDRFERLTYRMYREKMLAYASKLSARHHSNIRKSGLGRLVDGWMKFYQFMTLKDDEQELTNFDYFMHYAMLDMAYFTLEGNINGLIGLIPMERGRVRQINAWQSEKEGNKMLEISRILNKIGIIKFLGLDKKEEINRLRRKYSYKEGGVKLLLKLINQKYESIKKKG